MTIPAALLQTLNGLKGFNEQAFVEAHQQAPPISVRLNPAKPTTATNELPVDSVVPWCADGRYLQHRPSFTLDPAFHAGAYYVQEASSMFLHHIITQLYTNGTRPNTVLDLCAAPGGKSTLMAAALPTSLIVANEVIQPRAAILTENITKWGTSNIVVTNNDPRNFAQLTGFFDLMVVDAPCSGSGLFRKDEDAIAEWSETNVQLCSMRQQRILADAIPGLKENGFLIYSTCSYSPTEDEDICDWIVENLKLENQKIPLNRDWGIVETTSKQHGAAGYRFYPDKINGEGFFVACFKKPQSTSTVKFARHNSGRSAMLQKAVAGFLSDKANVVLNDQKEIVIAWPQQFADEIATLSKVLQVKKAGVAIGTIKGKQLVPHHELALSGLINDELPKIKLGKEDALRYLRRQDLALNTTTTGWCLCTYEQLTLGWVKVLPNRVNNYYPTNWRILKT